MPASGLLRAVGLLLTVALLPGCGGGENPEVLRTEEGEGPAPRAEAAAAREARPAVVFMGTSLTAGLGLMREEEAFPGRIQARIDEAGLGFRVVNAGVSGETTAGGVGRIDWLLRTPLDVLVLELGANDGLRGLPPEAMQENLDAILSRTRREYPDADLLVVGMEAPPNLGARYVAAFREVFRELARRHDAALVPFLLEGVGGVRELNQPDGIHPTAEGHEVMADNVWRVLEPLLRERVRDRAGERPGESAEQRPDEPAAR